MNIYAMKNYLLLFILGAFLISSCKLRNSTSDSGVPDPSKVVEDTTEYQIPSFVDPTLHRLDFEQMMILGSNPRFTFDFPIKDKDGKLLSREEIAKVTYQTKNLMDMYANENGKVILGVIRPGSPREFATIKAASLRYFAKMDSFKRLDSLNNK